MSDALFERIDSELNLDASDAPESLINSIFTKPKQKHLFLFNQNLRRTNIQVAELIALLRTHTCHVSDGSSCAYIDVTDFVYAKGIAAAAIQEHLETRTSRDALVQELHSIFRNRILLEVHYGTASVFLPPHLSVDTDLVCGESGYIHSCGRLLLLRNATKATEDDFHRAIHEAKDLSPKGTRLLLVPYCHEDFTPHDRGKTPFLTYGLDDVKIHLSKAHVANRRLTEVIDSLAEFFGDSLFVASAGDYEAALAEYSESTSENTSTIWIIADSDIINNSRFPGEKKFYIIYLQTSRNHNFYHLFDENKPGWASHTTLPHSLTGAMLNLARPSLRGRTEIRLADPFGGSGTTYLESQKITEIRVNCSDLAPIYEYVIADNIKFFNLSGAELNKLVDQLIHTEATSSLEIKNRRKNGTSKSETVKLCFDVANDWSSDANNDFLDLDNEQVSSGFDRVGQDLYSRIVLYLMLKTFGRSQSEIERGSAEFRAAFNRERDSLIEAAKNFRRYREGGNGRLGTNRKIEIRVGPYSPAATPEPPQAVGFDLFNRTVFSCRDVRQIEKNMYDVILTDPPYGFNTDEGDNSFSLFVREMIQKLVEALKDEGGQLIMACPAASFTGKPVIPFIRSDYVTREVIRIAADCGKKCTQPAYGLPSVATTIRPPYYWVAEKTLRRRILHFWIAS